MQIVRPTKMTKYTVSNITKPAMAVLALGIMLSACSLNASTEPRTDLVPIDRAQAGSLADNGTTIGKDNARDAKPQGTYLIPKDRVQANKGGSVTIEVIWKADQVSADQLSLSVSMDTHSVNLDQFDLSKLSVLRNDKGQEVKPIAWNAPAGGHHLKGILTFSLMVDGKPLIEADTKYVELVIRDLSEENERVLRWEMKER